MTAQAEDPMTKPMPTLVRRLPILAILLGAALGAFLLRDHLSFDALAKHRETLLAFRDGNFLLAGLTFAVAYIVIVAFSLPGVDDCHADGGSFCSACFPACCSMWGRRPLARLRCFWRRGPGSVPTWPPGSRKRGGAAARLQQALRENEWSALLIMRLVPAVPFFIANLLPVLCRHLLGPLCADHLCWHHTRWAGVHVGRRRTGRSVRPRRDPRSVDYLCAPYPWSDSRVGGAVGHADGAETPSERGLTWNR